MSWQPIPMKFPGTCIICNKKIEQGETGLWGKNLGVKHEKCPDIEIEQNLQSKQKLPEEILIPNSFLKIFDVESSLLKLIVDPFKIEEYYNQLISNLQKQSSKNGTIRIGLPISDRSKGTTVDVEDFEAFWLEKENFWWASKKLDSAKYPRFRNLFGFSKPKWFDDDGRFRNHQVCEINPSLIGDMYPNGAFLTDGKNVFLSTWEVGGEFGRGGHFKEIKEIFLNKSKQYTIQSQKKSRDYFLIANLNSTEFLSQISFFVKNLHQLKSRFEQIDRSYPATNTDSNSTLSELKNKGISTIHAQILEKFLVYEGQSITDSTKLRGIKGVSKIPSDSIVSEPHYMHNLVRGVYKPEGDEYALSIQTNPNSIWGSEINFETGEWKINYDFGDETKYSSDISSLKKCYESNIPIGVIYKPEKGVNQILGLGRISSIEGTKFIIIPYEIEDKLSKVESLSSTFASDEISQGNFSAQGSESTVYVRAKQGKFKELLLQEYGGKCAFCEFDEPEYMIGAHIVPYNVMRKEDPQNAMNPSDGILLCKLCDIAFERGDILLQENLQIIISEKLKNSKNNTVKSWLSEIHNIIPINSESKFKPNLKFIQRKLELIRERQ
jgi:hypothetical protein